MSTTTPSASQRSVTTARRAAAWRMALVSASCAMRTAASSTWGSRSGSGSGRRSSMSRPASPTRAAIDRRSTRVGSGARSAASPSVRSTRTVPRMAVSASFAVSAIHPMLSEATSGRVARTRSAACARMMTAVRWWATTSCSSRAMRVRSSATTRWASTARRRSSSALRWARSREIAAWRCMSHPSTTTLTVASSMKSTLGQSKGRGPSARPGPPRRAGSTRGRGWPPCTRPTPRPGGPVPVLVAVYPATSTGSRWNSVCNVAP